MGERPDTISQTFTSGLDTKSRVFATRLGCLHMQSKVGLSHNAGVGHMGAPLLGSRRF